jgi:guanine deaminase
MSEAIGMAIENVREGRGGPFAALVVCNGNVVARGANQVTSTNDPTAHAEIVAIRNACRVLASFQLTGCDIYTSCEPCPMCMGAIYWARPARVYFAATRADAAAIGFDDDYIYRQIALPPARRDLPLIQMKQEDALAAFAEWRRKPNKVLY